MWRSWAASSRGTVIVAARSTQSLGINMSTVEKFAVVALVIVGMGAIWHFFIKRYWWATSFAAVTGAIVGFLAFEMWRWPDYAETSRITVFLFVDAFILAAGVGIPFRRFRKSRAGHVDA